MKTENGVISTWQLPSKTAANKTLLLVERMQHYRFKQIHKLKDGTRVIPTIETCQHVLDAYDMFNLQVALAKDSYTVYVE